MRTFADVNDDLTRWTWSKPASGSFSDRGRYNDGPGLGMLTPADAFDALAPGDVFDALDPSDAFDGGFRGLNGPDDLCPLGDLTFRELHQLSEFDGFWSSITSGIKKVAKVVTEKGLPVLKYGIPGIKNLGNELAKVGRFVVKQPLLQKALASAIPFVGPFVSGPLLEVAASMVEQQGKKLLVQSGLAPTVSNFVNAIDAKTPARTESSPRKKVLPAAATVGFSPLPAAGIKKADFARSLGNMAALPPVAQKIAQRFVRAGIPALKAIEVVAGVDFGKPGAAVNAAYIGSLALAQQHARNPR